MKKIILLVAAIIIVMGITYQFSNMQDKNKVEIGDRVPEFVLKDQNGNDFSLKKHMGNNALVIYFYPKDDTPGCTKEACAFRDAYEIFTDLNVEVVGISADNVASHKKFKEKYNLPFTLLADTNNVVRNKFGVPKSMLGLLPGRVTYIINKEGIVIYIFNSQFGTEKHITKSLEILQNAK